MLATAQTGTGKTAGFTLPILQRLLDTAIDENQNSKSNKRNVRVLVLTPTRELAGQVTKSVDTYGKYLPFKVASIFGGVGMEPQIRKLKRGSDIVVATPGRLLDHLNRGTIRLNHVEALVLDEADRMLDMGFIHDIRKILDALPADRQNLMFSATFDAPIRKLAAGFLDNPTRIDIAPKQRTAERVSHVIYKVKREAKTDTLISLIKEQGWHQALVFAATKHGADRLSRKLDRAGLPTAAIHGNKSQAARTRALTDFKKGKVQVLVATDIAARGIDIQGLEHVVNFELPHVPEDYVHRIGRTGRAGAEGQAVSLVGPEERQRLKAIERMLKAPLEIRSIDEELVKAPSHLRVVSEQTAEHAPKQKSKPAKREKTPRQEQKKKARGASEQSRGKDTRSEPRGKRKTNANRTDKRRPSDSVTGSVKFFNARKGFGYVAMNGPRRNASQDVFIHASALERAGISRLRKGQRISFKLVSDHDGRTSAAKVRLVD